MAHTSPSIPTSKCFPTAAQFLDPENPPSLHHHDPLPVYHKVAARMATCVWNEEVMKIYICRFIEQLKIGRTDDARAPHCVNQGDKVGRRGKSQWWNLALSPPGRSWGLIEWATTLQPRAPERRKKPARQLPSGRWGTTTHHPHQARCVVTKPRYPGCKPHEPCLQPRVSLPQTTTRSTIYQHPKPHSPHQSSTCCGSAGGSQTIKVTYHGPTKHRGGTRHTQLQRPHPTTIQKDTHTWRNMLTNHVHLSHLQQFFLCIFLGLN